MCGIEGLFGLQDRKIIKRMNGSVRHRGPNDEGYFFDDNISLAHRRLSIIDLDTGKQPIFNEDKSVVIILNGEIYNFKELKKDLENKGHKFYTNTDTEVIVHLYEEECLNFVKYLDGMFALAIYDIKKKRLILARDHVGIKPLYYSIHRGKLIFGSEIKAIFTSGLVKPEFNSLAIKERYIFSDYYLNNKTLFKKIKQLPPGTLMLATADSKYKLIPYTKKRFSDTVSDEKIAKRNILKLLRKSVECRLVSDVPLGTFLSGGLDSSIIAALHKEIVGDEEIHTFSVTDEFGTEDSRNARCVSQHINSNHHEFVFGKDDIVKNFIPFIYHEENIDYGSLWNFILSKYTKRYVTVVLTGNGSDELFAGYDRFKNLSEYRNKLTCRLRRTALNKKVYEKHINSLTDVNQLLKFDQTYGQLSNFQLHWVDKTTMAFGLEARVPFLSKELVNYVNLINSNLKIKKGIEKYILRKAVESLRLPEIVKSRRKFPAGVTTSPKAISEFENYCKKLIKTRKRKRYDKFLDTPIRKVSFDLLEHLFVENEAQKPKNMVINDIY